jgi:hypothetical protein
MSDKQKKKPGPKRTYSSWLGDNESSGLYLPPPITNLMKEKPTQRLLNWMVQDKSFKEGIISLVPAEDPTEPGTDKKG